MPVEARWDIEDERRSLMPASHLARRRARVPRRARIALLAAAGALVAMAAILAAASALPVPEPAPTPTPHSAFEAAAIEAEALARGDRSAFLSVQDSADIPWFTAQRESFQAWGEPPRGLAYDLMDSGGLPGGRVWIAVRQYRAGEYVVETRVYQRRGPRWMRVRPDAWLDDSPGAFDTVHFHVEFPANMQRDALLAAAQFEREYNRLCLDLGCRPGPGDYRDDVYGSSIYPRALNMESLARRKRARAS